MPSAWLLAMLALGLVAPMPALAEVPATNHALTPGQKPDRIPEPREQHPGDTPGFRLPFATGQEVRIDQGWNTEFSHNGKAAYAYDFGLDLDTPVLAAADGVVAYVHDGETGCGGPELLKKANYVTINHADGSATQYGHLSSVDVEVGDVVVAGQVVGKSGDTGYSGCMPHLHFARQYQGGPVTQSVPIYFEGYADREFHSGEMVTPPTAPCAAPTADSTVSGEPPLDGYCGSYFHGTFDGPAIFTRPDARLSFDWRTTGPGGYWLDDASTGFSARWSGRFAFDSAGTYAVGVISSGWVIVSIDDVQVVNRWIDRNEPIEIAPRQWLQAGVHKVDVDYLSTDGHGMLKVDWHLLPAPWFANR